MKRKSQNRSILGRWGMMFGVAAIAGGIALSTPNKAVAGDAFDYEECLEAADALYDACVGESSGFLRKTGCALTAAAAKTGCVIIEVVDILT